MEDKDSNVFSICGDIDQTPMKTMEQYDLSPILKDGHPVLATHYMGKL